MKNALENTLSKTIKDWVGANKKVFWKYEVSSYYKTYTISVANLPDPSNDDIRVLSNNRLLNNAQKTQLCKAIKKVCPKAEVLSKSNINVKVDFEKGAVTAAVI
ncbi:MAG TPA: hypothetical protein PK514_14580 [Spirochaetota bacterium]|nr:hypothetical protein [Spirochaetota bacterium]